MDSRTGELQDRLSPYAYVVHDVRRKHPKRLCTVIKTPTFLEHMQTLEWGLEHPGELLDMWFRVQRSIVQTHREIMECFGWEHTRFVHPLFSKTRAMLRTEAKGPLEQPLQTSVILAAIEQMDLDKALREKEMQNLQEMCHDSNEEHMQALEKFAQFRGDIRFATEFILANGEEGLKRMEGLVPPNAVERLQTARAHAVEQGLVGEALQEIMEKSVRRYQEQELCSAVKTLDRVLLPGEVGILPMEWSSVRSGYPPAHDRDRHDASPTIEAHFVGEGSPHNIRTIILEPHGFVDFTRNTKELRDDQEENP